jgi:hypothetical protein
MAEKRNEAEEEYFARIEREQVERLAEELAAEKVKALKEERRKLHAMKCGKCGGDFVPKPFRGVTIDVCTSCGAVLLDPGELEILAGHDQSGVLGSIARLFKP